jgi:acyl-CoA ligase (AMP-forming) (exosortase A-associated)
VALQTLIHHDFLDMCPAYPDKPAVIDSRVSLTYRELAARAGALSAELRARGIARGDRVAFMFDHTVEQAVSILAIAGAGAVFVPVNWALFPEQVAFILRDAGARALVTDAAYSRKLKGALPSCLEQVLVLDRETPLAPAPLARDTGAIGNDLAALLYTSGSTGAPKGVMVSHRNLRAGCDIVGEYLGLTAADTLLGVLQLSFDYGLNQLLTMLSRGGTYRFLSYLVPDDIVRVLRDERISGFAGVPQIWIYLTRSSLARTPLPHLRFITNSGGPVPAAVLEFLRAALPYTDIVLMYGLTEAFRSTYLRPGDLAAHPGSIGKAIPDTEILVMSDSGALCEPDEPGELVHRGPTVSLGYWNRPEETACVFREIPLPGYGGAVRERVVFSGDLVRRDEDGFLYFIARRDAMIKSCGIRVSPSEVEEVVYRSGCVLGAAAVGVPDPVSGQAIVVFAVPGNGFGDGAFEETVLDHCSQYLPLYMVPRRVFSVPSLPRTPHGKTDYPSLQTAARERWEAHETG